MEPHFLKAIVSAFHPPLLVSLIISGKVKAEQVGTEQNTLAVEFKSFSLFFFFFLRMRLAAKAQVRIPAPPFSVCVTLKTALRPALSILFHLCEMGIITATTSCGSMLYGAQGTRSTCCRSIGKLSVMERTNGLSPLGS